MKPVILNHFSRRREFIEMLRERGGGIPGYMLGVEIGTDHGQYAEQLLQGIPNLQLNCIDPWLPYKEGDEVHDEEDVNRIYEEAKNRLFPYPNCGIIRKTSMEAVKQFEDNFLDFVFIDANHSYKYVLEDITKWTEKVKPGGIVAGHDYKEDEVNDYGVIKAVQHYTTDNHVAPWFILHAGGSLVDCWMFIKQ